MRRSQTADHNARIYMDSPTGKRSFASLSLAATLGSLDAKGYESPTPVQAETIPTRSPARTWWSSRAPAPARPRPSASRSSRRSTRSATACRRSCSRPTRELAIQVAQEITELGRGRGVKVQSVYGGDSMERQIEGIRAGAHVIVGTPGRVLDHLRRGTLDFSGVHILVLDEADRMLDMGFAVEMGQIMEFVPPDAADAAVLGHGAARASAGSSTTT